MNTATIKPPAHLSASAKKIYKETIEALGSDSIETLDIEIIAMRASLIADARKLEKEIYKEGLVLQTEYGPKKNPKVTILRECRKDIISVSRYLKLDPSELRTKGGGEVESDW